MPWPPHRTLYELGRGGMGVVELAEVGDRLVAVKRILPYRAGDAQTRSAFLREARLLERIDHPNVVRALGVDEGAGGEPPALMMQYVAGVLLKDLLAASPGGLSVAVAARLGADVALGLHAAHELCDGAGRLLCVVHRDVSPHNVLVTFEGRAVLLDFGVAKVNDATRTVTGEVKGKLAYMAPEQAMADPVDRRSDLYALGALLYEMLSGRRMHGEGTDLEILKRMVSERPAPLGSLRPGVPEGLARLVSRMTDESPERRPAAADEVAAALEPFAGGAGPLEVASCLEEALPGVRERHDRRLFEARAAAVRGERASHSGGEALAPPGLASSAQTVSRLSPAPSARAASLSTRGEERPSMALARAALDSKGGAKAARAGRTRALALVLGAAGLVLGLLGINGVMSDRRTSTASGTEPPPAVGVGEPSRNAAAQPPASSPPATIAASTHGAPVEAPPPVSAAPPAAPSPRRVRQPSPPPRKQPPPAPASGGVVRPTPPSGSARPPSSPLPVDTHAIGGDDN